MEELCLEDLQQEIVSNHRLAFVIGNGINRYADKGSTIDWESMLISIWNNISKKKIKKKDVKGISLTEFYDVLSLQLPNNDDARERFVEKLQQFQPVGFHTQFQKKLMKLNCPVLTTNFDELLESGLKLRKMNPSRKFTDYYPWECYWGNKELNNPLEGFGIWHINGMLRYKRSIRLGLAEYIRQTSRTKDFIHSKNSPVDDFDGKETSFWEGYYTWLHIVFNCDLLFFGLGLDKDEVFLRWLLIEREKYFLRNPHLRKKGWYVYVDPKDMPAGKKMFLESVGIKEVKLNSYKDIYVDLFNIANTNKKLKVII